jgi:L-ribulose-5-phosphate 4-epimerase
MLKELKELVCAANLDLVKYGLVLFTWGNVSAADRKGGVIVIKPGGVSYQNMTPDDMTVVDFDGRVVEGRYKPSSDTLTHIELYKAFPEAGSVVHTHSTYAAAWAQAKRGLPCYGTTHADYFYGEIPVTRELTAEETETAYEKNTGLVIAETFAGRDPAACPAVLAASHGPFIWGKDAAEAVHNAVVLEEIAKMAAVTLGINPAAVPAQGYTQTKHYTRKHGKNAYYGQGGKV